MRGEDLKRLREERGVKAAWLARQMGETHRQRVHQIETKKDVSVEEFVCYTTALGLKPGDLLENSAGDLRPLIPLVEELKKFSPNAAPRVLAVLQSLHEFVADTWLIAPAEKHAALRVPELSIESKTDRPYPPPSALTKHPNRGTADVRTTEDEKQSGRKSAAKRK